MEMRIILNIYIEKYDRYEGVLIADFIHKDHFIQFCNRIDQPYKKSDERTMLYIEDLHFISGIYPKEGCIYAFPNELIVEFSWVREPIDSIENSGSDVIAFRSKSNKKLHSFFSNALKRSKWTTTQLLSNELWDGSPCGASHLYGKIKVIVKNVGQGNWNEVYANNKCELIYDLGASIHFNTSEIKQVITSSTAFNDCPSLIISHWDIDHYKAVFQIDDSLLSKICCIFCPSKLPNLTSERAFKVLQRNCCFIHSIKECDSRVVKRKISLDLYFKNSNFVLFRGEKSADRNKSGLSMAIWSNSKSIILSGDHHYYQLFEHIYKEIPSGFELNLITPHHGGEAGNLTNYIPKISNVNIAATSTGKNSYGHPYEKNRKSLAKMGFKWLRTDNLGKDIEILLS
jgi:beta-lactamase superfamily II metal-dependent hydrolase